jgi:DNA-binding SARP family transcriptional activator/TolB-like protein
LKLRLRLFGHVAFETSEGAVHLSNRKSRALLAYLATSEGGIETRDRLVSLLWSSTEPERARASLRQAIYELRTSLGAVGFNGLLSDNLSVSIDLDRIESDYADVLDALAHRRIHHLLLDQGHLPEALLEDLAGVDENFESWLRPKRKILEKRWIMQLEEMLRAASSDEAERQAAAALYNLDNTYEPAVRALMRGFLADGDTASALKIYKELWELLQEEFETEPNEETQALLAKIKLGEVPVSRRGREPQLTSQSAPTLGLMSPTPAVAIPALASAPPQQRVVVAIGAFELGGETADRAYLFQAFRRELISQLVRFREWLVCDLHSAAAGTGAAANVDYVIEGAAVGQKDSARLILTLQNRASGVYLWSERLPIDLASWFDTQQEIVRRLAAAMNIYLSAGRLGELVPSKPADLSIYDRWLRAQTRMLTWDPRSWHEAEEGLKAIIEEAPRFAPAYASLASVSGNIHFYHPGVMRSDERHRSARGYAEQAVKIDPLDSRAHLALGWASAFTKDYDSAIANHAMARDLNDSDPWTLTSVALSDAFCQDGSRSDDLCRRAFDLTPSPSTPQWGYRAQVSYICGKYSEAAAAAANAESILHFGGWRCAAIARSGDKRNAAAHLEQFFEKLRARWFGLGAPTPEAMTAWFLHLHPIRDRDVWLRLRDGLEAAGAPRVSVPYFE